MATIDFKRFGVSPVNKVSKAKSDYETNQLSGLSRVVQAKPQPDATVKCRVCGWNHNEENKLKSTPKENSPKGQF